MRDRIYRTEALILRRNDFGEADRLLLVATPGGKQRIIAKGVRKTTSRLAGSVELFTHVTLLLAVGRNLDIVTQGQVHQHFPNLHASLERLGCAYYTAELYDQFVQDEQDHRPAFRLLVDTFAALDTSRNPDLILRAYELHLLHVMGYRPQLQRCVVSHELLTEEASLFSPMLGGVLAPSQNDADRNALFLESLEHMIALWTGGPPYRRQGRALEPHHRAHLDPGPRPGRDALPRTASRGRASPPAFHRAAKNCASTCEMKESATE
ncbi:MAG: DNA repair protein RecO [Chloroflexaceae bacterium]|nr:DNA repair protein RecO [Chloroflexaceae bacterium]